MVEKLTTFWAFFLRREGLKWKLSSQFIDENAVFQKIAIKSSQQKKQIAFFHQQLCIIYSNVEQNSRLVLIEKKADTTNKNGNKCNICSNNKSRAQQKTRMSKTCAIMFSIVNQTFNK